MFDFTIHSWSDVAAIVTIAGVPVALVGLWLAYRQMAAQSELQAATYEDGFVGEYRKLVQQIPTKALLGEALTEQERADALNEFYHYIDLCNEQAYQARMGRIRKATWKEWKSGIEGNLRRPEFARAWPTSRRGRRENSRTSGQSLRRNRVATRQTALGDDRAQLSRGCCGTLSRRSQEERACYARVATDRNRNAVSTSPSL